MSLVLDSSICVAWSFKEEHTRAILQVLDAVIMNGAVVPPLWRLEVANAFQMAVHRRTIEASDRDAFLADLACLNIEVDPDTDAQAWGVTLQLADRFRLTLYDAAYLELAQRRSLPLATLDAKTRAAAQTLSIPLLGL